MLFDLQGPRKTAVKVIYLGLAILMAGGLVLFGIGSNVQGGIADVFGSKSSADAARDQVNTYSKSVSANPDDVSALSKLIAARYALAGDESNFNPDDGTFSEEGKQQLELAKDDWTTYKKKTGEKASLTTANYAVSVYLGLQDAKGATTVQEYITEREPNSANYLALMLYASYAGNQLAATGAEQRALALASKDEKQEVEDQIKQIKEQIGERNAEVQKQIQEQFSQQQQQTTPSNPFSGVGSGAAAGAGTSTAK